MLVFEVIFHTIYYQYIILCASVCWQVSREPPKLFIDTFKALNDSFSGSPGEPYCRHLKVKFEGELGEGDGVVRNLFTIIAEVGGTAQHALPCDYACAVLLSFQKAAVAITHNGTKW